MTTAPDFMKHGTMHDVAPLRGKWKWILALGIVYVLTGALALGRVVMATVASVWFVGLMMILAGVAQVINAFQVKSWGSFFLWLALGVLYIMAGFAAFENPLMAAALLTLLLGVLLVASGVVRLMLAFSVKTENARSIGASTTIEVATAVSVIWVVMGPPGLVPQGRVRWSP